MLAHLIRFNRSFSPSTRIRGVVARGLHQLTPKQRDFVNAKFPSVLVVEGPTGTGKTQMLVERAKNLITKQEVASNKIGFIVSNKVEYERLVETLEKETSIHHGSPLVIPVDRIIGSTLSTVSSNQTRASSSIIFHLLSGMLDRIISENPKLLESQSPHSSKRRTSKNQNRDGSDLEEEHDTENEKKGRFYFSQAKRYAVKKLFTEMLSSKVHPDQYEEWFEREKAQYNKQDVIWIKLYREFFKAVHEQNLQIYEMRPAIAFEEVAKNFHWFLGESNENKGPEPISSVLKLEHIFVDDFQNWSSSEARLLLEIVKQHDFTSFCVTTDPLQTLVFNYDRSPLQLLAETTFGMRPFFRHSFSDGFGLNPTITSTARLLLAPLTTPKKREETLAEPSPSQDVCVKTYGDEFEETRGIIIEIRKLIREQKVDPKDICVMLLGQHVPQIMVQAFHNYGINVNIGCSNRLIDDPSIKFVYYFFRAMKDLNDNEAIFQLLNSSAYPISRADSSILLARYMTSRESLSSILASIADPSSSPSSKSAESSSFDDYIPPEPLYDSESDLSHPFVAPKLSFIPKTYSSPQLPISLTSRKIRESERAASNNSPETNETEATQKDSRRQRSDDVKEDIILDPISPEGVAVIRKMVQDLRVLSLLNLSTLINRTFGLIGCSFPNDHNPYVEAFSASISKLYDQKIRLNDTRKGNFSKNNNDNNNNNNRGRMYNHKNAKNVNAPSVAEVIYMLKDATLQRKEDGYGLSSPDQPDTWKSDPSAPISINVVDFMRAKNENLSYDYVLIPHCNQSILPGRKLNKVPYFFFSNEKGDARAEYIARNKLYTLMTRAKKKVILTCSSNKNYSKFLEDMKLLPSASGSKFDIKLSNDFKIEEANLLHQIDGQSYDPIFRPMILQLPFPGHQINEVSWTKISRYHRCPMQYALSRFSIIGESLTGELLASHLRVELKSLESKALGNVMHSISSSISRKIKDSKDSGQLDDLIDIDLEQGDPLDVLSDFKAEVDSMIGLDEYKNVDSLMELKKRLKKERKKILDNPLAEGTGVIDEGEDPDPIVMPILKSSYLERHLNSSDPEVINIMKDRIIGSVNTTLKSIIEREKKNVNSLIATEKKFRIKIPIETEPSLEKKKNKSISFAGQFDRLEKTPEGAIVLKELKTNDNAAFRVATSQHQQIALYYYALSLMYPGMGFKLIVESIKSGVHYELVPNENTLQDAKALIEGTVKSIRKGLFYARPTFECMSCEHKTRCVAYKQSNPLPARSPSSQD